MMPLIIFILGVLGAAVAIYMLLGLWLALLIISIALMVFGLLWPSSK